ncbi:hypothetical protein COU60_00430 [Candidatus Pacearchaeota archaeon CG10_big_fil_rev_8_21_14_0_10_34_76]|nr:MAG: hypothetical protein COU60_00430 [Candidatus Pacearchaeota archaeon CG10_big_fil_rev_8_21_14_0_10_34_76]
MYHSRPIEVEDYEELYKTRVVPLIDGCNFEGAWLEMEAINVPAEALDLGQFNRTHFGIRALATGRRLEDRLRQGDKHWIKETQEELEAYLAQTTLPGK